MFIYDQFLAIDYGTSTIKGVLFQKVLGKLSILRSEIMSISHGEEDEYRHNILRFINSYFPGETSVVLNLPLDRLFVRELHIPLTTIKAIREVIPFEVENRIPFPMETVEVTGNIWRIDQEKSDVIAYSAHHSELDFITAPFFESNIVFRGLFVDSVSLSSVISEHSNKEITFKNCAQVDIGGRVTILNLLCEGKVAHTRYISVGGDTLTDQIASDLKIPFEKAEAIKLSLQFEPFATEEDGLNLFAKEFKLKTTDIKKAFQTAAKFAEKLSSEIHRSIVSMSETERPEVLYLSGGGSKIRGIESFLGDSLGLMVRRYDFLSLNGDTFSTCLGMGYHFGFPKKDKIDFIDTPHVKRINKNILNFEQFRPHLIFSGISLFILITVFFVGIVIDKRKLSASDKMLAEKFQRGFGTTVPEDVDILEYAAKLKNDEKKKTEIYRLYLSKPSILDILFELSMNFPSSDMQPFQLDQFDYDQDLVKIGGRVNEFSEIGVVQRSLEKSPMFKDIEIADKKLMQGVKNHKVSFVIKMKVTNKPVSAEESF
ncbi:cell division FtsA domain-containing protein [Leptospira alstonii]|uniref:cell division FtsA domain-containing protein n=1 Tax=Leptospira alstonii TaxID=28452 RepID=UPI000774A5F7|nr:cell division FtsA domain-containing protein [Leptospira alstonii]